MGNFLVRYASSVVNYDCSGFLRLATDVFTTYIQLAFVIIGIQPIELKFLIERKPRMGKYAILHFSKRKEALTGRFLPKTFFLDLKGIL